MEASVSYSAVIGDTPYGFADPGPPLATLSTAINADSQVNRVVHLGDVKSATQSGVM